MYILMASCEGVLVLYITPQETGSEPKGLAPKATQLVRERAGVLPQVCLQSQYLSLKSRHLPTPLVHPLLPQRSMHGDRVTVCLRAGVGHGEPCQEGSKLLRYP